MSTSIEERAKTSYLRSNVQGLTIASSHEVGYIQGATEQAEITKKEMIIKVHHTLEKVLSKEMLDKLVKVLEEE